MLDIFKEIGDGKPQKGRTRGRQLQGNSPGDTYNPFYGRKLARVRRVRKLKREALQKQRRLVRDRA